MRVGNTNMLLKEALTASWVGNSSLWAVQHETHEQQKEDDNRDEH